MLKRRYLGSLSQNYPRRTRSNFAVRPHLKFRFGSCLQIREARRRLVFPIPLDALPLIERGKVASTSLPVALSVVFLQSVADSEKKSRFHHCPAHSMPFAANTLLRAFLRANICDRSPRLRPLSLPGTSLRTKHRYSKPSPEPHDQRPFGHQRQFLLPSTFTSRKVNNRPDRVESITQQGQVGDATLFDSNRRFYSMPKSSTSKNKG